MNNVIHGLIKQELVVLCLGLRQGKGLKLLC